MVPALFSYGSFVEYKDVVILLHCFQAVCDGNEGFAGGNGLKGFSNLFFSHSVKVCRRFIKYYYWSVLQQNTRNGYSLPLTSTEFHPVLAGPLIKF